MTITLFLKKKPARWQKILGYFSIGDLGRFLKRKPCPFLVLSQKTYKYSVMHEFLCNFILIIQHLCEVSRHPKMIKYQTRACCKYSVGKSLKPAGDGAEAKFSGHASCAGAFCFPLPSFFSSRSLVSDFQLLDSRKTKIKTIEFQQITGQFQVMPTVFSRPWGRFRLMVTL